MKLVDSVAEVRDVSNRVKAGAPGFVTNFYSSPSRIQAWVDHRELLVDTKGGAAFFFRYLLEWRWITPANLRTPARIRFEDVARVHTAEYLESLTRPATLARIFGVDAWDVPVDEVLRTMRLGCGGTLAAAREALARHGATVNLLGGFHHAGPGHGAGPAP